MRRRRTRFALLAGALALCGTAAGSDDLVVLDVTPGAAISDVDEAIAVGGFAYYPERGPTSSQLVRTDGRTFDTVSGVTLTSGRVVGGNDLWFMTQVAGPKPALGRVGGGGTAAEVVAGPAQGFTSFSAGPFVLGDRVLFVADGAGAGLEPWSIDAATLDTTPLAVTAAHPRALLQGSFQAAGNRAVFWVYDPPLAWVPPSIPNPEPSDPSGGTLTGWVTDGTAGGTQVFATEIVMTYRHDLLETRGTAAGLAWFVRRDDLGRTTLWRTDGTAQGTFPVTDPAADAGWGAVTEVGGRAVFLRAGPTQSARLWTSDGTRDGTAVVPGAVFPLAGAPVAVAAGSRLFLAPAGTVWSSDLTAQPESIGPGVNGPPSRPSGLSVVDGRVLFVASDPVHGLAVWTSDGTPFRTRRLRDGLELEIPTIGENFTHGFTAVGDRILFTAWDEAHGWEMRSFPRAWVADPLPPLAPDVTSGPREDPPVQVPDVAPSGRIHRLRARVTDRGGVTVLKLRGAVRLARGSVLSGDRVIVGAGDFVRAFAADSHGAASDARGSFRTLGRPRPGRTAEFVVTIRGADAEQALAGTGRKIPVAVHFDHALRTASAPVRR